MTPPSIPLAEAERIVRFCMPGGDHFADITEWMVMRMRDASVTAWRARVVTTAFRDA